MDKLNLRIELPAYSHSFDVNIPPSSTILEVKGEIARTCPGQPRLEGQRLIWRGRNLANEESVDELWKSPADSRTLHLAVHPSAWVGEPPGTSSPRESLDEKVPPSVSNSSPISHPSSSMQTPFPLDGPPPTPASQYQPIPYIALKHQNAVKALTTGIPPEYEDVADIRLAAKAAIERVGWSWPAVLDERYPVAEPGGLTYELIMMNGQQYLSLANESVPATPVQKHALAILSYTFSLLNLSVASSTFTQTQISYSTATPQVNQLLQQLGLPQLRVIQPNQNALLPRLREVPLRPLLMPLMLLLFRTLLLLYFVAPARKPIFGILILAWMLYEIWQPIRNGLLRVRVRRLDQANDNPANPDGMNNNNPQAAGGVALPANAQGPIGARQIDAQAGAVFDTLSNMNLQAEESIVNQSHLVPVPEPSLGHKLISFFGLLLSTLHPAIWNRRRAALKRREGVIRTEANMRREPSRNPDEEETEEDQRAAQARQDLREQHARRPQWVQRYMERVVAEEWVDDLD